MADAVEVITSRAGSAYALRCIEALESSNTASKKIHPALAKLKGLSGVLVVGCLRAYAEGGLPEVYAWAGYPAVTSPAAQADAQRLAAELYADCFLVCAEFVADWNRRQIREVA